MSPNEDAPELEPGDLPTETEIAELKPEKSKKSDVADVSPSSEKGLVRADPLRRYMWEIRHFPTLSAEEELALVERYRAGDQEAATQLISSNLKLVVRVAMMYNKVYSTAMDMIQEGNIGLLEAVKRFDPFKGARLPTYATWWIKAYIIKFLLDNFRIVRVGTTNARRRLLFNLRKEKEKLRLQGIEPTHRLIAEKLNVSEEDVREVEPLIEGGDISLNFSVSKEDSTPLIDRLEASEEALEDRLARGELKAIFNEKLENFANDLSEREKAILYERLIAEDPATLQNIADRFGVSREAIRLNEKSLVNRIKEYMEEALRGITQVEFNLFN
jgi:RNA polymerase sigma-32 factor